ncbi:family 43 glycosylhydrolase [Nocardia sp. NPDC046473]|uniref:family 43 glycosylhydrolase n=1 Tax=Nocardia sp. NPDC046473 TaxID=3155733 RepID=UPI0034056F71
MTAALVLGVVSPAVSEAATAPERVKAGEFTKVYDPTTNLLGQWYINDHTFVFHKPTNTWHMFGITHVEPADPATEVVFAHAIAPSLHGPWMKQPPALHADPAYGERHLWAPHIVFADDTYYMFYAAGPDGSNSAINLATSTDLYHWVREPSGSLFTDGYDARDPMVTRVNNQWVMYYTATWPQSRGHHVVAYRTSTDLRHWQEGGVAYTDPTVGTSGGNTESPFVVHHGEYWYLFIGPRPGYVGTTAFYSDNPLHFDPDNRAGQIDAHAAEVIDDRNHYWVSSAGDNQGGVSIAPLIWYSEPDAAGN